MGKIIKDDGRILVGVLTYAELLKEFDRIVFDRFTKLGIKLDLVDDAVAKSKIVKYLDSLNGTKEIVKMMMKLGSIGDLAGSVFRNEENSYDSALVASSGDGEYPVFVMLYYSRDRAVGEWMGRGVDKKLARMLDSWRLSRFKRKDKLVVLSQEWGRRGW